MIGLGQFELFYLGVPTVPQLSDQLNSQGMLLPEMVYFQGLQGPIKIWEIEYNGDEQGHPRGAQEMTILRR